MMFSGKQIRVMWIAVGLALLAALTYVLMQMNVLGVGDLATAEKPAGIIYAAAGGYVLGGLLILLRRRWLWVVGAVINGLVIMAFLNFYQERPSVLFSPGGVASKTAQLLLELGLVYLIISDWRRARRARQV
jgi:hypothetical protein